MDQYLKQRLVGAIVISAIAVIFVPMIFEEGIENTRGKDKHAEMPEFPQDFDSNLFSVPADARALVESGARSMSLDRIQDPPLTENAMSIRQETISAWALQLGSFKQKDNAIEFRDKLRKGGYAAFVESVDKENTEYFRVRVGPELSRKHMETMRDKLSKNFGMRGIIVAYLAGN